LAKPLCSQPAVFLAVSTGRVCPDDPIGALVHTEVAHPVDGKIYDGGFLFAYRPEVEFQWDQWAVSSLN
jgi:hypothetical protein